jgi:predicted transglutaminase-like cysteine proteinase
MYRVEIPAALFSWLLICTAVADSATRHLELSTEVIDRANKKYGAAAQARLLRWQALIPSLRGKTESEKIRSVNDFINQTPFVSDLDHWGKTDYWATPAEMIASNGGDCEDFAIAKYFTLLATGVLPDKLRITYVLAALSDGRHIAHMVLAYYTTPDAEPLILDNLKTRIFRASERSDLTVVYYFNGTGLWVANARKSGEGIKGGQDNISIWRDLNSRMGNELQ